jgi:cytidyltransferase-like protein
MGQDLLSQLDALAFKLQYYYMRKKITRERISRHYAFFHPRKTAEEVMKKYHQMTRSILVTGVFDILHSEHKKLLSAAKKLGGILLVGIETDTRVRRLKGPGRPINPLRLRLKNLQQLGIADQVFSLPKKFNDLNHFRALINQIRPDILAVSASTPNLPSKRRIMKHFAGRVVVVLPHNPYISTTKLIK